jgi:hypothetical protein
MMKINKIYNIFNILLYYIMSSFPSELTFATPLNLIDSTTKAVRLAPTTNQVATGANQIFKFDTGVNPRTFLQPSTMSLNFDLEVHKFQTGATPTDDYIQVGSGFNCFNRQVISANGNILETIQNNGSLAHQLLKTTASRDELYAMMNVGCHPSENFVKKVPGTQSLYKSYSLPILGILNTSNTYIPLFVAPIELEFSVSDYIRDFIVCRSGDAPTHFTISNVTLTYNIIELDNEPFSAMLKMHPGNLLNILTSSYSHSTASLVDSAGIQTSTYSGRFNSLKNLYMSASVNSMPDRSVGSVNINLRRYPQLCIGGHTYPQNHVDITNYAVAYTELMKNFGSMYSYAHSGSLDKSNFARACVTAYKPGLYELLMTDVDQALDNYGLNSNQFYMAIDLEKLNGPKDNTYNGVSSIGSSSTISWELMYPPGEPVIVNMWSHFDVTLQFNMASGMITEIH